MKKLTIFLLTLSSYTAQAQIVAFNDATKNDFLGIGGYAFTIRYYGNNGQILAG